MEELTALHPPLNGQWQVLANQDALTQILENAQLIDQFTAKGVMFLMLIFTLVVCYFLIKKVFAMLDGLKMQVESQQVMEKNIEKLSETTRQSLEFLRETIKEQREYNEKVSKNLETLIDRVINKIQKMDSKYTRVLSHSNCKANLNADEYEI